jgi:hypothetical protein
MSPYSACWSLTWEYSWEGNYVTSECQPPTRVAGTFTGKPLGAICQARAARAGACPGRYRLGMQYLTPSAGPASAARRMVQVNLSAAATPFSRLWSCLVEVAPASRLRFLAPSAERDSRAARAPSPSLPRRQSQPGRRPGPLVSDSRPWPATACTSDPPDPPDGLTSTAHLAGAATTSPTLLAISDPPGHRDH